MNAKTGVSEWEGRPVLHWRDTWAIPVLEIHDSLTSTNDRARELDGQGAPRFATVLAEEQTAGRGRGGRHWESPPGGGLWLSVLATTAGSTGAPLTPILAGLAVTRAIAHVAPTVDVGLKWPNDVLVRGRKVCGILCEGAGKGGRIIVGIGVNVRQADEEFPGELAGRAISLDSALGSAVSRPELAQAILRSLMELIPAPRLSEALLEELGAVDALLGRAVRVSSGPVGTAQGITTDGALLVKDRRGYVHEVRSGSVRWDGIDRRDDHRDAK